MKDNFTRIAIILDRSGSMQVCRETTVAGFNKFIKEQKEQPGEVTLKLVQFDDQRAIYLVAADDQGDHRGSIRLLPTPRR